MASATANSPRRALVKQKGWIKEGFVYLEMGGMIPSKISHMAYYLDDSNGVLSKVDTTVVESSAETEASVVSEKKAKPAYVPKKSSVKSQSNEERLEEKARKVSVESIGESIASIIGLRRSRK